MDSENEEDAGDVVVMEDCGGLEDDEVEEEDEVAVVRQRNA